jgi:tyrosyl-tRNA synthetase
MSSIDGQVALLMQGTEYGDPQLAENMALELRERLVEAGKAGRALRIYCGYDPRTADLHVGHTITMRKLRQFQDLGHEVTFLIGTFTSLVGDPSDKDSARPRLTPEEVERNARTYAQQAFRILDPDRTLIRHNATWLSELKFGDLIHIASNFTVQQFLARENFRKRYEAGEAIYLHEFFYALMQAYDAVAMETDVQVGGSDQLFNIIVAGRKLQEAMGQRPQIGIIMGILPGTDGVQRMSKSTGNHIPIMAEAWDMYGKVMSLPDEVMVTYFRLVTRYGPEQVAEVERRLAAGENPRDVKMELAREIVSIFHGDEAVGPAEADFGKRMSGEAPPDVPVYVLSGAENVVDVIAAAGLVRSKSEARRLVRQGAVKLDGERIESIEMDLSARDGERVLQVGRWRFLRLTGR